MSVNFAPYQSSPPESTRALSPPRTSTTSPSSGVRTALDRAKLSPSSADTRVATNYAAFPPPSAFDRSPGLAAASRGNVVQPVLGYQDIDDERGGRDYLAATAADAEEAGYGLRVGLAGDGTGIGLGNVFETGLGFRMDYEACLAYLLLPPAGGVVLLVFETKSDYVRFHAWQSALVFSVSFVLHLLLSWSSVLSWLLFIADLALIVYLTMRAYRDAETLDRAELPFFGALASRFVDNE